mgnify:CR=1 FL=1
MLDASSATMVPPIPEPPKPVMTTFWMGFSGALKFDHPVNEAVLSKYGRDNISIYPCAKESLWYFDFGTENRI